MDGSLDTNVLVRFICQDVPGHYERALALLATPDARYEVADAVWIELAYALRHHYGMDRSQITDVITSLVDWDSVVADSATIAGACQVFATHPKLSFVDCYLAAHAASTSAVPLFTFDEKLASQHLAVELVPSTTSTS